MAASNPSTILLKGEPTRKERDAGGAITPGDLLKLDSDGDVTVHGTAGGDQMGWVAVENDIAGDDLDDDYASGEVVQIHHARPGDELYMWLADGENVSIGDYLESAGGGDLRKYVSTSGGQAESTRSVFGIALEAVDLSNSANTTHGRIKVLRV